MRVARVQAWLGERVPIAPLIEALRHKRVPQHRYSVWYYFGGITLFLFVVQVVTGGLLLLYYRPSAGEAYESVQFLMTRVQFGWLVRSIHAWSANLMVASAFGHLFSVLFLHGYRRPREVTWVSGAFLLFLVLAFGFTGYLLPWNQLSFFATSVGTDMAGTIPWIGHFIVRFLRGGDTVGMAAARLMANRYIILPVVDADGRYIGLFGVFELLGLLLPKVATLNTLVPDLGFMADDLPGLQARLGGLRDRAIGPLARRDLPVLRPDTPIIQALLLLYRNRITLPVVEEASGRLVGVLSYWDALAAVGAADR